MKLIGINSKSSLVDNKVLNKLKGLFSDKRCDLNKEMLDFVNVCLTTKYKDEFFPAAHY